MFNVTVISIPAPAVTMATPNANAAAAHPSSKNTANASADPSSTASTSMSKSHLSTTKPSPPPSRANPPQPFATESNKPAPSRQRKHSCLAFFVSIPQETTREDPTFWTDACNDRSEVTSAARSFTDLNARPLDQFTHANDNIGNRLASTAEGRRESHHINKSSLQAPKPASFFPNHPFFASQRPEPDA
jgi:hypothetical protein